MTAILGGVIIIIMHVLGTLSALMALMSSRTSQGAIAWIISLLTFPYLALPAYWIFGRPRFYGYVSAREERDSTLRQVLTRFRRDLEPCFSKPEESSARLIAVERLAMIPMSRGNKAALLIDGEATFQSLFEGLRHAQYYVLVQFFIVRDDRVGQALKQAMIDCAHRDVRVCFLYDEIGSRKLPDAYLVELQEAGVEVSAFGSSRGWRHRFQVNFRNHRKITIVDGIQGWVGGLNVGEEYRYQSERYGHWRDTHLKLEGPAVLGLQEAFWEDWHWATGNILSLNWQAQLTEADQHVVIVPSGPADHQETASLMVQQAIHGARERFWVATPYFVPDQGVRDALKLAALRGIDVRVLLPEHPDHLLVFLSAFSFLPDMIAAGVKIYRYQPGFLHQKVFLIDHECAAVGTVNLDNRSFRLNFEVTAYIPSPVFAAQVETMLLEDFKASRPVSIEEIQSRPFWRKMLSRAAYLAAPIQ
ncbi:cardiolipin synthase [Larsenimonas suaedae]|uniref:Cardiolipin synthase n=1 Tax=Larsenimonas suaedae TaxID=1851019 RepID=A0ABU1GYW9_9GAMM|nr:cardiolipin synthase [Larsenimonas suaedae]MCM2971381.1 cardiolipin synthase [Larsenimonas suaedae]MDR5896637.1 cardiolipin synthase [Larsenimonas suaedae]